MDIIRFDLANVKRFLIELKENPGCIFDYVQEVMSKGITGFLNIVMEMEITVFLGRKPYERSPFFVKKNYRNGSYERSYGLKGFGEVIVKMPRDRNGEFHSDVIPRYQRCEDEIAKDVVMLFMGGLSTRSIGMISERLLGYRVSPGTVSNFNELLQDRVFAWRNRDLSDVDVTYVYVDGVNFECRLGGSVEKYPVLVAIAMTPEGTKTVLGFQGGDKESASSWREFFKDLKARGLDAGKVRLGIMDGLPGLEKVFGDEFPSADIQRCQVHLARNVMSKVPVKMRQEVGDHLRDIFYASSREKAMSNFEAFKEKYKSLLPSAVMCLEKSVDRALTYLKFDPSLWVSLRTTNPIERLNKEFKRRTKPMEIAGGEASLYNILAFVSLKMECGWRDAPVHLVEQRLPVLRNKFTQKS